MNKVRLGRTGLAVTPLCFGASGLGDMPDTYGYDVDAERAKATVRAIFDGPVNFLDTSRIYGMVAARSESAPSFASAAACPRVRPLQQALPRS